MSEQEPVRRMGDHGPGISPLDEAVDHVRGPAGATLVVEYGD